MSSIKIKQKVCKKCETLQYIFSKGLCKPCAARLSYEKQKDSTTYQNKPKSVRRLKTPLKRKALKKKFPKPTGEGELFKKIWEERDHICQVSGVTLTEDMVNFSHILPKGRYPEARLDPENIWIITWQLHHEWEHGDRMHEKFKAKRAEFEKLKEKYNNQG